MDAHEDTPRIEVLSVTDTGRRRRWTDDEKVKIVEESHQTGETVAEVARRHEISRSQLYDWRHRYRHGLLCGSSTQFLRLVPVEAMRTANDEARSSSSALTIDLGARCRVTMPADFDRCQETPSLTS
jgi:transposase